MQTCPYTILPPHIKKSQFASKIKISKKSLMIYLNQNKFIKLKLIMITYNLFHWYNKYSYWEHYVLKNDKKFVLVKNFWNGMTDHLILSGKMTISVLHFPDLIICKVIFYVFRLFPVRGSNCFNKSAFHGSATILISSKLKQVKTGRNKGWDSQNYSSIILKIFETVSLKMSWLLSVKSFLNVDIMKVLNDC